MLSYLTDPQTWAGFLTLTVLEIVLSIDNLVFLAITSNRLPAERRPIARRTGLAMALVLRIALLVLLAWMAGLSRPLMIVGDFAVSWRDIVLGLGGLYLFYKGVSEIHGGMEAERANAGKRQPSLPAAIIQIVVLDVVFSLDSIVTAVGMTDNLPVMIAAIVVAIGVMLYASGPVADFINAHPTVKMLALAFLILVGMALVADAVHFHIPRGYLYFAIAFSLGVEALNLIRGRRTQPPEGSPPGRQP